MSVERVPRLPRMWTSFQLVKLVWTELLNVQGGGQRQQAEPPSPRSYRNGDISPDNAPSFRAAGWEKNFGGYFPGSVGEVLSEDAMKRGLKFPSQAGEGGTAAVLSWRMAPFSAKDDAANNQQRRPTGRRMRKMNSFHSGRRPQRMWRTMTG